MADHPDIRVKPPFIFLGVLLASTMVSLLAPMPVSRKNWLRLAGIPFLAGGFALLSTAFRLMRRKGTNVDPSLPANTLVTEGPYRYSRNPMYLGFTFGYIGLGLLANTLWFLPFTMALMAILQTQVIRFEEAYLENKFGPAYRGYREQVRRWL
jgi:protein-S-isoprenylcysteine O-methyltransferase Ste14